VLAFFQNNAKVTGKNIPTKRVAHEFTIRLYICFTHNATVMDISAITTVAILAIGKILFSFMPGKILRITLFVAKDTAAKRELSAELIIADTRAPIKSTIIKGGKNVMARFGIICSGFCNPGSAILPANPINTATDPMIT